MLKSTVHLALWTALFALSHQSLGNHWSTELHNPPQRAVENSLFTRESESGRGTECLSIVLKTVVTSQTTPKGLGDTQEIPDETELDLLWKLHPRTQKCSISRLFFPEQSLGASRAPVLVIGLLYTQQWEGTRWVPRAVRGHPMGPSRPKRLSLFFLACSLLHSVEKFRLAETGRNGTGSLNNRRNWPSKHKRSRVWCVMNGWTGKCRIWRKHLLFLCIFLTQLSHWLSWHFIVGDRTFYIDVWMTQYGVIYVDTWREQNDNFR